MSVLIQKTTLVIRRERFDDLFPGGLPALQHAAKTGEQPARFFSCDDAKLLNLGFADEAHAAHMVSVLLDGRLKHVDEATQRAGDFVLVREDFGPVITCDWLAWARRDDGFTFAWDTSASPHTIAAPGHGVPARADAIERESIDDESGRRIVLSSENGVRSYLDFRTGMVIERSDSAIAPEKWMGFRPNGTWGERPAATSSATDFEDRLGTALTDAIDQLGWTRLTFGTSMHIVEIASTSAIYRCNYMVFEARQLMSCTVSVPLRVPRKARLRLADFIARFNSAVIMGALELNIDSGLLSFRCGTLLRDTTPSAETVSDMALFGVDMLDKCLPLIMDVLAGKRTAIDAVTSLSQD